MKRSLYFLIGACFIALVSNSCVQSMVQEDEVKAFDDVDKMVSIKHYKEAFQYIENVVTDRPFIYSRQSFDILSGKFLALYKTIIADENQRRLDFEIYNQEELANEIAKVYAYNLKACDQAIYFLKIFFFLSFAPERLVETFLSIHEKNGSLADGCDFVWQYVNALIHQGDLENIHTIISLSNASAIMKTLLDYCKKIDSEKAIIVGKVFIDYVLNENIIKTLIETSKDIRTKLAMYVKNIAKIHQVNIKDHCDACGCNVPNVYHDLVRKNKQYLIEHTETLIDSAEFCFDITEKLGGFTTICIQVACELKKMDRGEEANVLLSSVYNKYKDYGCIEAADGIFAFTQVRPSKNLHNDFSDVCSRYGIQVPFDLDCYNMIVDHGASLPKIKPGDFIVEQDVSGDTFFASLQQLVTEAHYMRAASLLRRALTDKTNIYSLEWLDSLSAIFFDLHEKAIASSLSYRQIEELEDIAVYISNAYIDKLKEPGKAVAFWETFFFACIFPISKNKILSSFLNAHEKNGTLKHGCQAVWNYIEALLHLNNDENAYSAVLLVMVPEAMRIMLDFCILVDREIAIDYGKKFIDYVIDANTLKNLATVSVSLYEKLWIKSGHLYIEQILCNHQKEIQRTGDTSCPFSDLIYRNKKHNSFSTIFSSNKLTGDIITTLLLGEFTAIAFKIACALSSVGKAKEAERFLCDLHHNYTAAGFVSAAEGIIAYIKANTQKEFDDVCDKYCIYEI